MTHFFLILLSFIGIVICCLLGEQSVFSLSTLCGTDGGCHEVTKSDFATVLEVPLWLIGLGQYSMLLGSSVLAHGAKKPSARLATISRLLFAGLGVLASIYFIYLQGWVIGSWCPLCLTSAGLQGLIFLGSWFAAKPLSFFQSTTFSSITQVDENRPWTVWLPLVSLVGMVLSLLVTIHGVTTRGQNAMAKAQADLAKNFTQQPAFTIGEQNYRLADSSDYRQIHNEHLIEAQTYAQQWYERELISQAEEISLPTNDDLEAYYQLKAMEAKVFKTELRERLLAQAKEKLRQKGIVHDYQLTPPYLRLDLAEESQAYLTLGDSEAKNEILYFGSLSCNHCKEVHQILEALWSEYGEDELRVVYLQPYDSTQADYQDNYHRLMRARYAFAQQGSYRRYVDWVYELGMELNDIPLEALESLVGILELDQEQWTSDIDSPKATALIEQEWALFERLNLKGFPTVYVNGLKARADEAEIRKRLVE